VRSDPILLERILLNLVSNAVRHTQRGKVVVGCRRRGATLQIEVWDSGPGIPAEQRANIFSEFVRLAPSEAERGHGLGLGLAIVQRLCELLGHELALVSRVDKGSRFSVRVPFGFAVLPTQQPSTNVAGIIPSFDGQLVLVIDDDALVLDSTSRLLSGWGCSVITSASVAEALAALTQLGQPPKLIIADFNLADGRTGVAAIEAVRARFHTAIPAFLISADATPERLGELRAAGYELLRKPVSAVMLRAMMLSMLKQPEPPARPTDQPHVRV
jgi:CheY-like chemotaxis protein